MNLVLYHRWLCPYSQIVRDYIEDHELREEVDYVALEDSPEAAETLENYIGSSQVPCLIANDRPILESSDIISWLDTNFVQGHDHVRP